MDQIEQINFFHIHKTAGTTLQYRMSAHEWAGNLPKGSTLVLTWKDQKEAAEMQYRVNEDLEFDPNQTFGYALQRKLNQEFIPGNARICMGHCVHSGYEGKFVTWLRDPLERSISYLNHAFVDKVAAPFQTENYLLRMYGNWQLDCLYEDFLGYNDNSNWKYRYPIVRQALQDFYRVWDSKNFEDNWLEICDWYGLPKDQFINNQRVSGVAVKRKFKQAHELDQDFLKQFKKENKYDYMLYKEFCLS